MTKCNGTGRHLTSRRYGQRGRERGSTNRRVSRFDLEAYRLLFHRPTGFINSGNGRAVRCACEGHVVCPPNSAFRVGWGVSGERGLLLCFACAAYVVGIISKGMWRSQFHTERER